MNKIFIINGPGGSGKTLFGELVKDILSERGVGFHHASSIDPVKEILLPKDKWTSRFLLGDKMADFERIKREVTHEDWDGVTKDVGWRNIMYLLKERLRRYDPELIHSLILTKLELLGDTGVMFVDIREAENIEGFKEHCRRVRPDVCVQSVLIRSDTFFGLDTPVDRSIIEYAYDIEVFNRRFEQRGDREASLKDYRKVAEIFVNTHILGISHQVEREI